MCNIRKGHAQDGREGKCGGRDDRTGQNGKDDGVDKDDPKGRLLLPSWPQLIARARAKQGLLVILDTVMTGTRAQGPVDEEEGGTAHQGIIWIII